MLLFFPAGGGSAWCRGGVLLGPGGWSAWSGGGSPWSRGGVVVCLVRGVLLDPGGILLGPGGVVCLVRGGSPWSRGGWWSAWSGGGSPWSREGVLWRPPPVNRITDTCKNITMATTSLRPVNITFPQPLLRAVEISRIDKCSGMLAPS